MIFKKYQKYIIINYGFNKIFGLVYGNPHFYK